MPHAAFPDVFLTPRLRAERMRQSHLSFITQMHANADVMATMGGTRDAAASRLYLAQNVAHWLDHGYGMYVLQTREHGALAGRAGLKFTLTDEGGAIELAYAFEPDCWGRGYAVEIATALVGLGFRLLPVDTLCAVAIRSNAASRRVLEKIGMRLLGDVEAAADNANANNANNANAKPDSDTKVRYEIHRRQWRDQQDVADANTALPSR
ncbi:N-acetyltransferase [Achromobacter spanius]|uniref:N-acetyltransferase n=2 Tax=Achromobacter spanius TaxID=217203 RepID=A0A2S5GQ94_9BURK|nr:GNAT family N-acetyltransferase [Achromobacter spanius]PPA75094.1 N-acetyltransferase [Achromobacter spanius]